MGIDGIKPSYNLQINQHGQIDLLICHNNNISMGSTFEEVLGAKLIMESGPNVRSAEVNPDIKGNVNIFC